MEKFLNLWIGNNKTKICWGFLVCIISPLFSLFLLHRSRWGETTRWGGLVAISERAVPQKNKYVYENFPTAAREIHWRAETDKNLLIKAQAKKNRKRERNNNHFRWWLCCKLDENVMETYNSFRTYSCAPWLRGSIVRETCEWNLISQIQIP